MEQLSIAEALATQTLPFVRSQSRGWGVQCKYLRSDGSRCRKWAISGGYVCYRHGGQFAVVRQAAETRKMFLATRAYMAILDIIENGDDPAVRLSASKYAIKFAGLDPGRIRSDRVGRVRGRPAPVAIEAPKTDIDAQIESLLAGLKELEE